MKTAVSIPDPLFRRADSMARTLHVSRSELYTRAIERFVDEQDEALTRAALDEVYGVESSALPAGAAAAQAAVVSEWSG